MLFSEEHTLSPFLPEHANCLLLGSFPPDKKKWSMDFYYPNLQNDMWRIFGLLFFDNKNYFFNHHNNSFDSNQIKLFLTQQHIAVADVGKKICRLKNNASDHFLEVIESLDLFDVLTKIPHCTKIIATGGKSSDIICEYFGVKKNKKVGDSTFINIEGRQIMIYRAVSSSRETRSITIEEKVEIYRNAFSI
ncbi:MAG: uracil-DNA glycosylase family protein [Brevinema sp.]